MKFGNLLLLVGGYGLGQGSIFLAQTWLVSHHNLALVAQFGVSFYMATLAIMLADFGSIAVLARETAAVSASTSGARSDVLWANYWAIFPAKLATAIAVIVIGGVICATTSDAFSRAYIMYGCPALLIWAFNATGMLDGLRMSGMNGLTGAMPFIVSGASLVLVSNAPPQTAGAVLGASLSVGYCLALAGQMLALQRVGQGVRWIPPSRVAIAKSCRSGFAALLSTLPGQLYFRLQLLLTHVFLGAAGTALFVYAKQIIIGFAQIINFLRRVEFPDLVRHLEKPHRSVIGEVFHVQRFGTLAAAGASFTVLIAGFCAWKFTNGATAQAGLAAAMFSPVIITSALLLGFTQAITAQGRYHQTATAMVVSMVIATALSICLGLSRHLGAFAAADTLANCATIAYCIRILRRDQVKHKSELVNA